MWTMTQGHEPHGDGEGREELLIRACGISYGYHRTDSVLPPWLLLSRHRSLRHQLNAETSLAFAKSKCGDQGEPGVKFTQDSFFLESSHQSRVHQFGHHRVP